MEVDQESQWDVQQLHVADELRLMNRRDFPHSLQLYQQTRFDQDVELQALLKHDTLVLDPDVLLFDGAKALQLEFAHEAFLIDAFQQPGPEGPVDFDGSSAMTSRLKRSARSKFECMRGSGFNRR